MSAHNQTSAPNQTSNADAPRGSAFDALLISFACLALSVYAGGGPVVVVWALVSGVWFGIFLMRGHP